MFKDIKDYEGRYQVSSKGEVYSTPQDGKPNKLLKQETTNRNSMYYKRVAFSKEGKVTRFQVHRLVAKAFIPNPENKPFVNHIDNDGTNNDVNNLEWCTHEENMLHSEVQGRQAKSHYLGGKAAGKIKADKAVEKWDKRVGKLFGVLKIVKITDYSDKGRGDVLCTVCSNITNRTLQGVYLRTPDKCRKCYEARKQKK